jgi:U2 small nuclear ribonucleoprotein B''
MANELLIERKQALEAHEVQKNLKRPAGPPEPAGARPIKTRGAGLKSTGGAAAVIPDEYLPPNKTLFVQNIPDDYDVENLSALFGRFEGFREVRLVPGRKGIAFVEYDAEAGAISAKERMANMPLGETSQQVKVTFQRQ